MEMINAIGRRKSAVARVYLTEGTGKITINKKDLETYFPSAILQYVVKQPLQLLEAEGKYDIKANLDGGGFTGQSQALRLAIARALVKVNARNQVNQRLVVASNSASVNIRHAVYFADSSDFYNHDCYYVAAPSIEKGSTLLRFSFVKRLQIRGNCYAFIS